MWLMTSIGFFSIVEKSGDKAEGLLTVRARCRSDLLALKALYLPQASDIEHSEKNDYRYRLHAPKSAVSEAIAKLVSDIDYPNFKQRVQERQGGFRAKVYHEVWSSMYSLQQDPDLAEWLDEDWWSFASGGPMPSPGEEVCVLKVGLEGGSLSLMAQFDGSQWQYWEARNDQFAKLFDDEDFKTIPSDSGKQLMSWQEASDMLSENSAWFLGYPLHIHPWFTRRVLTLREQGHG